MSAKVTIKTRSESITLWVIFSCSVVGQLPLEVPQALAMKFVK